MNNAERWLRINYWTGAIVDGLAWVQLMVPRLRLPAAFVPAWSGRASHLVCSLV